MKLTTITTTLKNNTLKMLAGAAVAGAILAAAPAANAQRVFFGVHVGGPAIYAPAPVVVYGRPGYYAPRYDGWRDRDDFRFRRDFDDHRDWDRRRDFDRRDFDHRGWDRR